VRAEQLNAVHADDCLGAVNAAWRYDSESTCLARPDGHFADSERRGVVRHKRAHLTVDVAQGGDDWLVVGKDKEEVVGIVAPALGAGCHFRFVFLRGSTPGLLNRKKNLRRVAGKCQKCEAGRFI